MAYTTINKSSLHMNTKTFTGNGGTQSITGVGFQPDWTWLKKRNGTANNHVVDAVRGVGYYLYPNLTNAQGGNGSSLLTSFNTDGFTLDAGADSNASGATGVSWNWKANGAGSANTAGSINSTVSANTTSGFSIVKYTGTGSTATVGHGLGAVPDMMIIKKYSGAGNQWTIYHKSLGNTKHILFTLGSETSQANYWNNTSPTSSVWTMGNQGEINGSGTTNICYAFSGKQGYSKFGSYTGNNNADGTFIYTGFSPAFIMVKKASDNGGWQLRDNKRTAYGNETLNLSYANSNTAEQTTDGFDFLSNGFKWRNQASDCNGTGNYIYAAFAEAPLVGTNNTPCTAR